MERFRMTDCKMLAVEGVMVDRITDLPRSIIDCILEFLPIEDVARTSILSRKWRYMWASTPYLVFDGQSAKKGELTLFDFVNLVNTVLLQHSGPVVSFSLDLSSFRMTSDQYTSYVDKWLLFLSRNGIRELYLKLSDFSPYRLPSSVYSPLLTVLDITDCIFKIPGTFGGFNNLTTLILKRATFLPNTTTSILKTPHLGHLQFLNCTGMQNVTVCAPSLVSLVLEESVELKSNSFMTCPKLTYAYVSLRKKVQLPEPEERIFLSNVLGNWPLLSSLYLDGFALEYLTAGTTSKSFSLALKNLRQLSFYIKLSDANQVSWILPIVKYSPNLQKLEIGVQSYKPDHGSTSKEVEKLESRLLGDHEDSVNWKMDKLLTVKFVYFKGSRIELILVRHILSCSPLLKRMLIQEKMDDNAARRLDIGWTFQRS